MAVLEGEAIRSNRSVGRIIVLENMDAVRLEAVRISALGVALGFEFLPISSWPRGHA